MHVDSVVTEQANRHFGFHSSFTPVDLRLACRVEMPGILRSRCEARKMIPGGFCDWCNRRVHLEFPKYSDLTKTALQYRSARDFQGRQKRGSRAWQPGR